MSGKGKNLGRILFILLALSELCSKVNLYVLKKSTIPHPRSFRKEESKTTNISCL